MTKWKPAHTRGAATYILMGKIAYELVTSLPDFMGGCGDPFGKITG